MARLATLALVTSFASLLFSASALAQTSEEGFDKDPADTMAGKEQDKAEAAAGDKMPGEKDKTPADKGSSDIWDTKEDPTKPTRYVGVRFRHAIVPKFILNIFADGGTTVHAPMGGLEFGTRRDHLEFVLSLSYADYSSPDMLVKGKGEPDFSYERVRSDLSMILAKFEILYEIPLDKQSRFALLLGGGVGLGGVIGDLYRTQVAPPQGQSTADPNVPSQWRTCPSSGVPDVPFCSNDNKAFGDNYKEPSWASGGSLPFIFPWIAVPQVSFRYKPIKYLQARADVGFAISSGFYFGASIDYIL